MKNAARAWEGGPLREGPMKRYICDVCLKPCPGVYYQADGSWVGDCHRHKTLAAKQRKLNKAASEGMVLAIGGGVDA